ncbi:hypothetical protein [Microbacterium sp. CPCC 204701]|uniref:hypothetical protein n=1 Tax=Microbacterium sp. CPCC 204701 TaxID=2493084 RepID=UPI000FDA08B3|nr:hypothetical protein [Microbacterium sp. CPCC 204701]
MLQRVFVDTDILASPTQHAWLVLLRHETGGLFQLHSSSDAATGAVRAWVARDPGARGPVARRRLELLVATLDEVVDAEASGRGLDHGHPSDLPLEPARSGGAHVLLTSRVSDATDLDRLPFDVCAPDRFLCLVDDSAPLAVREVARRQDGARRSDGPRAAPVDALIAAGCPAFAERVARHLRVRELRARAD